MLTTAAASAVDPKVDLASVARIIVAVAVKRRTCHEVSEDSDCWFNEISKR